MYILWNLTIWYHFLICTYSNRSKLHMKHSFFPVHFATLNSLALFWTCIGHDFFQVNSELKKLLVASVGDDLQYHFQTCSPWEKSAYFRKWSPGWNIAQLSEQLEPDVDTVWCVAKVNSSQAGIFYFISSFCSARFVGPPNAQKKKKMDCSVKISGFWDCQITSYII